MEFSLGHGRWRERLATEKLTPRQRAEMLRRVAFEEAYLSNYEQAKRDLEAAIATGALTEAEVADVRSRIADLSVFKRFRDGR